jgi:bacillithiol system protein YtxJ
VTAGTRPARQTLPERLFPLVEAEAVDRLLAEAEWAAIFKAGTSEKTFDAWALVQRALEPRPDVAVGLITLPAGRSASNRVAELTGIAHKSPQLVVFHRGAAVGHLDERDIDLEPLAGRLREWLPETIGPAVRNEAVISLDAYRRMLAAFVAGELPEERFQWGYLERLAREAPWREEETFARLNGLFENPSGRDVQPARLVAIEFQAQLAGRREPLKARAERLLKELAVPSAEC